MQGAGDCILFFAVTFIPRMNQTSNTNTNWQSLLHSIRDGDVRILARGISLIENEAGGYIELLQMLPDNSNKKIIGITGPPGVGKSTLVDRLIGQFINDGKKVAVLCVDPSSPFHLGALLGDRVRMSEWYNHPDVFIRSLATRGSLGGLHPKIIEITDLLKASQFDYIIVETVGVGQSEVEIAGLADTTVVVLVPEAGDEIQTMKAGLMEVADVFVVNKCDRPDADLFLRNLQHILLHGLNEDEKFVPVIKTIASQKEGIKELATFIMQHETNNTERKTWLLAEKAYQLIAQRKMKTINKKELIEKIIEAGKEKNFNLYKLIEGF
jgi:LAO/AO transport system kinase